VSVCSGQILILSTRSEYYDAFVSIQRGLFNTRDRAEHTRKRKTISHTFSARSISQFEQYIHSNLDELVKQWDRIAAQTAEAEYTHIDCLRWFNYLAFDIIGDLAFGTPFGMLRAGKDIAAVRKSPSSALTYAPAIQTINRRGEVSATLGCLPRIKPYAKHIPDSFFRNGLEAVENLAGIAVARVDERLSPGIAERNQRVDLLARLMEGKDEAGHQLGRAELTAEALTQMIAGSDTTSNTCCA
jgi:benzoate 4-monooxygenase